MNLEDYFDFISPDDIRIKGHRVGIDDVLEYFLDGYSPEEIQASLPTLNLEQIYATSTYYLSHQSELDAYLARLSEWRETRYQEWVVDPSPMAERMRCLKNEQAMMQTVPHENPISS